MNDDPRHIEQVVESLHAQLGAAVPITKIRVEVEADFAAYEQAAVRTFIPILVERSVRARHPSFRTTSPLEVRRDRDDQLPER
jgi:hypothetical protein